MPYQSGWDIRDCEGVEIVVHGFKPVSEETCKNKCDELLECTHAVYGGNGGITGESIDWWAMRCSPRKDFNGVCNYDENGMKTYVKEEKSDGTDNNINSA